MSENWINNTMKWLEKKATEISKGKKASLKGKFDKLNAEKILFEELFRANEIKKIQEDVSTNPMKKVIYNNSSKLLSPKQQKVLELGLNFAITPKKFPLIEYIAATENLCQALEEYGDDESVEKAQKIRNITINHIRKGIGMKIRNNLSADDEKVLKEIISNPSIVICPADKGKAIVIEDRDTYLKKCKSKLMREIISWIIERRRHC